MTAVQGPAICGACYPVPAERCEEIEDTCSNAVARSAVRRPDPARQSSWGIDIGAGVHAALVENGVEVVKRFGCTAQDSRWYSLRRAVRQDGPSARTGRHALVMARL